jgi:hypothetical protein
MQTNPQEPINDFELNFLFYNMVSSNLGKSCTSFWLDYKSSLAAKTKVEKANTRNGPKEIGKTPQ